MIVTKLVSGRLWRMSVVSPAKLLFSVIVPAVLCSAAGSHNVYVTTGGADRTGSPFVSGPNAKVEVVSWATGSVTKTIEVGIGAISIVASADGQYVYVANYGSDSISIISTEKNEVVQTLDLSPNGPSNLANPHSLAVTPDGKYLWAGVDTDYGAGESAVFVFALPTLKLVHVVNSVFVVGGLSKLVVSKDGNYVYAEDDYRNDIYRESSVKQIDVRTYMLSDEFYQLGVLDIALTPDGNTLYMPADYYNYDSGQEITSMYEFSTHPFLLHNPYAPATQVGKLVVSADGKHLIEEDGLYLLIVNPVTLSEERTVPLPTSSTGAMVLAPDGKSVFVAGENQVTQVCALTFVKLRSVDVPGADGGSRIAVLP